MNHETIGRVKEEKFGDGVGLVRVELSDLVEEDAARRERARSVSYNKTRWSEVGKEESEGRTRKTHLLGTGEELLHVLEERLRAIDFVAREDLGTDLLRVVDLESFHEDLCRKSNRRRTEQEQRSAKQLRKRRVEKGDKDSPTIRLTFGSRTLMSSTCFCLSIGAIKKGESRASVRGRRERGETEDRKRNANSPICIFAA